MTHASHLLAIVASSVFAFYRFFFWWELWNIFSIKFPLPSIILQMLLVFREWEEEGKRGDERKEKETEEKKEEKLEEEEMAKKCAINSIFDKTQFL